MKESLTIAMIQMHIEADPLDFEMKERNVDRAIRYIDDLPPEVDLVVLPEEFYAGYGYGPISAPDFFQSEQVDMLKAKAREKRLHIVGCASGLLDENEEKPSVFMSDSIGFVIGPDGEFAGTQNRIHVITSESQYVDSGKHLAPIDTPLGKLGLICGVDLLFPETARRLVLQGAEIILAPVLACENLGDNLASTIKLFQNAAVACACLNQVPVVMVNGVGEHYYAKLPIFGGSMFCTPTSDNLTLPLSEEGVRVMDYADATGSSFKDVWPLLKIRNSAMCAIA